MAIRTIFFVIIALVIQYIYLQGSLVARPHYQSTNNFSKDYKPLKYNIDDYTVSFEVPEATEVHLTPDKGQEMRFNIYFVNANLSFRGYIQVWIVNDLGYFLSNSKSLSPFDFVSYNIINITSNTNYGFLEEWTADFGDKHISALEYWFTMNNNGNGNEVLRISFFTDSTNYPDELMNIIKRIVSSLEIN